MEVIRGHLGCPLSGGCPLYGGSAIGGSTVYICIYIFQAVRRARAVNALRANVGPAG